MTRRRALRLWKAVATLMVAGWFAGVFAAGVWCDATAVVGGLLVGALAWNWLLR